MESFREALNSGRPLLGAWQQMACPLASEATATVGFDWVGIDTQHGMIGYESMLAMLQALAISGTPSVVRVSSNNFGEIGRALDSGAHGVIVPLVETAEQAQAAVAACRYPPAGGRSWGATRTLLDISPYTKDAGDERAVCMVMVETERGVDNIDAIASVPGVDAIYIGPQDLAISAGLPPGLERALDDPDHRALMERIAAGAARHGTPVGAHTAGGARASEYLAMGIRVLVIHRDVAALLDGAHRELDAARQVAV